MHGEPSKLITPSGAEGSEERLRVHPGIGAAGLERLQQGGPVAVIGLGTLGHRLAVALGPAGIPLLLVDHGQVEPANVGLQLFTWAEVGQAKAAVVASRLRAVRPDLCVPAYTQDVKRLGPGLLLGCRLIVGALDTWGDRIWLQQTASGLGIDYLDVALDGTGMALLGRASGLAPRRGTGCLTCGWDTAQWQEVQHEAGPAGCTALGNRTGSVAPPTLALPGFADTVAGLAAVQCLRLLLGEAGRVLGRELRVNLDAGRLTETVLPCDPRCRLGHQIWGVQRVERSTQEVTVGELFDRARCELGPQVLLRAYADALVREAACPHCRCPLTVACLRSVLRPCTGCAGRLVPLAARTYEWFGPEQAAGLLEQTWHELGLPPAGAVLARAAGREAAFVFIGKESRREQEIH